MRWPEYLQFSPKGSLEQGAMIYLNGSLSTAPWRKLCLLVHCLGPRASLPLPREVSAAIYEQLSLFIIRMCVKPLSSHQLPQCPEEGVLFIRDFDYLWTDVTDRTAPESLSAETPTSRPHARDSPTEYT